MPDLESYIPTSRSSVESKLFATPTTAPADNKGFWDKGAPKVIADLWKRFAWTGFAPEAATAARGLLSKMGLVSDPSKKIESFSQLIGELQPEWIQKTFPWTSKIGAVVLGAPMDMAFVPSTYLGLGLVRGPIGLVTGLGLGIGGRGRTAIAAEKTLKTLSEIPKDDLLKILPKMAGKISSGGTIELGSNTAKAAAQWLLANNMANREIGLLIQKGGDSQKLYQTLTSRAIKVLHNPTQEFNLLSDKLTKEILSDISPLYIRIPFTERKKGLLPAEWSFRTTKRGQLPEEAKDLLGVIEKETPKGTVIPSIKKIAQSAEEVGHVPEGLILQEKLKPRIAPHIAVSKPIVASDMLLTQNKNIDDIRKLKSIGIDRRLDLDPYWQRRAIELSGRTAEQWKATAKNYPNSIAKLTADIIQKQPANWHLRQQLDGRELFTRGLIDKTTWDATRLHLLDNMPSDIWKDKAWMDKIFPVPGSPMQMVNELGGRMRTPWIAEFGSIKNYADPKAVADKLLTPGAKLTVNEMSSIKNVTDFIPTADPRRISRIIPSILADVSKSDVTVFLKNIARQPSLVIRVHGDAASVQNSLEQLFKASKIQPDVKYAGLFTKPSSSGKYFEVFPGGYNLHLQIEKKSLGDSAKHDAMIRALGELRSKSLPLDRKAVDDTFKDLIDYTSKPVVPPIVQSIEAERTVGAYITNAVNSLKSVTAAQKIKVLPTLEDLYTVFARPQKPLDLVDMVKGSVDDWDNRKLLDYVTFKEYGKLSQYLRSTPGLSTLFQKYDATVEWWQNLTSRIHGIPQKIVDAIDEADGQESLFAMDTQDLIRDSQKKLRSLLKDEQIGTEMAMRTLIFKQGDRFSDLRLASPEYNEMLALIKPGMQNELDNYLINFRDILDKMGIERVASGLHKNHIDAYMSHVLTGKDRGRILELMRKDNPEMFKDRVFDKTVISTFDRPRTFPTADEFEKYIKDKITPKFVELYKKAPDINIRQDALFVLGNYHYQHRKTLNYLDLSKKLAAENPNWFIKSDVLKAKIEELETAITTYPKGSKERTNLESFLSYYKDNFTDAATFTWDKKEVLLPAFAGYKMNKGLRGYFNDMAVSSSHTLLDDTAGFSPIMTAIIGVTRTWKLFNLAISPVVHDKNILALAFLSGVPFKSVAKDMWRPFTLGLGKAGPLAREIEARSPLWRSAVQNNAMQFAHREIGATATDIVENALRGEDAQVGFFKTVADVFRGKSGVKGILANAAIIRDKLLSRVWNYVDHPLRLGFYKHLTEKVGLPGRRAGEIVNQFFVDYALKDVPFKTRQLGSGLFTFFPWTVGMLKLGTTTFGQDPRRFFQIQHMINGLSLMQEGTDIFDNPDGLIDMGTGAESYFPTTPANVPFRLLKMFKRDGVFFLPRWLAQRLSPSIEASLDVGGALKTGRGLPKDIDDYVNMVNNAANEGFWGVEHLGLVLANLGLVVSGKEPAGKYLTFPSVARAVGFTIKDIEHPKQQPVKELWEKTKRIFELPDRRSKELLLRQTPPIWAYHKDAVDRNFGDLFPPSSPFVP